MTNSGQQKTYEINIFGWGREIVLGRIKSQTFDYFKKNKIDLAEWASDWNNSQGVPEEVQPFSPGEWTECDDILHAHGADIDGEVTIEVKDEKGKIIWTADLDMDDLLELGCRFDPFKIIDFANFETGSCLYCGNGLEKGTFFSGNFSTPVKFMPAKLCFHTVVANIYSVCIGVSYDEITIENEDNFTSTNGSEFMLYKIKKDGIFDVYPQK